MAGRRLSRQRSAPRGCGASHAETQQRGLAPGPRSGLSASGVQAVLNELLELRSMGLFDDAGAAYDVLKGVEHMVLPSWREHGKELLRDADIGMEDLKVAGMHEDGIEKLYQGMYAFSFGFATVVSRAISQSSPAFHARLILRVSKAPPPPPPGVHSKRIYTPCRGQGSRTRSPRAAAPATAAARHRCGAVGVLDAGGGGAHRLAPRRHQRPHRRARTGPAPLSY
jgi:hypothetical protein